MQDNFLYLIALITMVGLSIYFASIIRLEMVYRYRRDLLEKVSRVADLDIQNKRDYNWRYRMYESVSFNAMMYKFWKPLNSFYPDKSFLDKDGEPKQLTTQEILQILNKKK